MKKNTSSVLYPLIMTLTLQFVILSSANAAPLMCRGLFSELNKDDGSRALSNALTSLFPQELRQIKIKESAADGASKIARVETLPAVLFDRSKASDPLYRRALQESVEIVYGAGSTYGHIILRVGEKVYDFGNVQSGRRGEDFRIPSETMGSKGYVFFVGRKKIAEAEVYLKAFYESMVKYNMPAYDASGSQLVILDLNVNPRFKSAGRSWGGKDFSMFLNNSRFDAKLVEDMTPQGKRLFLESPMGVRMPVGQKQDGTHFITGLSCASSATYVLKNILGLDIKVDSVSAKNLMRKMSLGEIEGSATPDVLVLYAKEKNMQETDLTSPTGNIEKNILAFENLRQQYEAEITASAKDQDVARELEATAEFSAQTADLVKDSDKISNRLFNKNVLEMATEKISSNQTSEHSPQRRGIVNWIRGFFAR